MDFSLNDVKTLKYINRDLLDFYINYLTSNNNVKKVPINEVDEKTRTIDLTLDKKATVHYEYDDTLRDIEDIFKDYPVGKEPQSDLTLSLYDVLNQGACIDVFTPNIINYYINQVLFIESFKPGLLASNIENGYFVILLKRLKEQLSEYSLDPQKYEDKYGKENLISLDEDCENGRKAGNMAVATSDTWEEDWKEFIKHDMQWDGGFFYYLIVHKLELMRKYYDPVNGQTSLVKEGAKQVSKEIDKALALAKYLENDNWLNEKTKDIVDINKRIAKKEKLWSEARRKFFVYLADHYEGWWD